MTDGRPFEPARYAPRAVRALGLRQLDGWTLKVYAIAYQGGELAPELVDAATGAA